MRATLTVEYEIEIWGFSSDEEDARDEEEGRKVIQTLLDASTFGDSGSDGTIANKFMHFLWETTSETNEAVFTVKVAQITGGIVESE